MSDRLLTPLMALGLALLVWLYTHSRNQEMLDRYQVPVEVRLDPSQARDYELRVEGPGEVPVTFTGPPSRIRELRGMLQNGEVSFRQTVRVPDDRLNEARVEPVVRLKSSELPLPPGVRAAILNRRDQVAVTLRRLITKELQVRVNHDGGAHIQNLDVKPNTVRVRGPREILDREVSINTELYLVPPRPDSTRPLVKKEPDFIPVVQELGGEPVKAEPPKVSITFTLNPRLKHYTIPNVPVTFLTPADIPYQVRFVKPADAVVTVRVLGPAEANPKVIAAYIDLTGRKLQPGTHKNVPIRVWLPTGFQLDSRSATPRGTFELVAPRMPPVSSRPGYVGAARKYRSRHQVKGWPGRELTRVEPQPLRKDAE